MYCSHCSAKIEEDHIFCPTCGKRLSEQPHSSWIMVWLKRYLWALAIILITLFFYYSAASDPYDTIVSQLNAIKSNELTKAYYGYTSPSFQEATTLEAFKEYIKNHPDYSTLVKADTVDKQEEGDNATLQVMLTPVSGTPFTIEYHLVKLEDGWKISALRGVPNPAPLEEKSE